MSYFNIPLMATNQRFNVSLGTTTYKLQLIYRVNKWFLDIFDTQNTPLICGLPVVMGDNLLIQHQHIISGSLLVMNTNENEQQNFTDLGTTITLYWSPS
ncbi:phage baseplate plug family protein [Acinetobacter sp. HY1485]|uniref:phage baseplate plug family protein n=1 Tax=Acinetobacter sp. HY1485 TaxID=2970918 RepID=UPI0022B96ECC|nr:hypothetical protein [Acinetobacter sp. HY1485]